MPENKRIGHAITVVMGILTIVATVIAAAPGFVQLSQDRPKVYYDTNTVSLLNPEVAGAASVWQLLQDNKIPDARVFVHILNNGDGKASEVRVGIEVPGMIVQFTTDPAADSNPVWVQMPKTLKDSFGKANAQATFKDLAITRTLTLNVGFNSKSYKEIEPTVEVFYDGKPAEELRDVTTAQRAPGWAAFKIAGIVFAAGVLLTIVVTVVRVFKTKEELQIAMAEIATEVLKQLFLKG